MVSRYLNERHRIREGAYKESDVLQVRVLLFDEIEYVRRQTNVRIFSALA